MKVNLKCVHTPNSAQLYTADKIYQNVEIVKKNDKGGVLTIKNDKGRSDYRSYKFNQKKQLYFGGYVFKIVLIAQVKE